MSIDNQYVGNYNVVTAYNLLERNLNLNPCERGGCLLVICNLCEKICVFAARLFNYIFGDHIWYNTNTACEIVQQYYINRPLNGNPELEERIRQIYQWLRNIDSEDGTYADRIDRYLIQHLSHIRAPHPFENHEISLEEASDFALNDTNETSEFELIALDDTEECPISTTPLEVLAEVFSFLDGPSLINIGQTCQRFRGVVNSHPKLYKEWLVILTHDRAFNILQHLPPMRDKNMLLGNIVHIQTKLLPGQAAETAAMVPYDYIDFIHSKVRALIEPTYVEQVPYPCNRELLEIAKIQSATEPQIAVNNLNRIRTYHHQDIELANSLKDAGYLHVVQAQASIDPAFAFETAALIQDSLLKAQAYYALIIAQSLIDKVFAAQCLELIPDHERNTKQLALQAIVRGQVEINLDMAFLTIEEIDPAMRFSTLWASLMPTTFLDFATRLNNLDTPKISEKLSRYYLLIQDEGSKTAAQNELFLLNGFLYPDTAISWRSIVPGEIVVVQSLDSFLSVYENTMKAVGQALAKPERASDLLCQANEHILPIYSIADSFLDAVPLDSARYSASLDVANNLVGLLDSCLCLFATACFATSQEDELFEAAYISLQGIRSSEGSFNTICCILQEHPEHSSQLESLLVMANLKIQALTPKKKIEGYCKLASILANLDQEQAIDYLSRAYEENWSGEFTAERQIEALAKIYTLLNKISSSAANQLIRGSLVHMSQWELSEQLAGYCRLMQLALNISPVIPLFTSQAHDPRVVEL